MPTSPRQGQDSVRGLAGAAAGTGETSDGPGVDDNVLGLEAQAVDGELNYHIHGVGLILWERHPLQEDGQMRDGSARGQLTYQAATL